MKKWDARGEQTDRLMKLARVRLRRSSHFCRPLALISPLAPLLATALFHFMEKSSMNELQRRLPGLLRKHSRLSMGRVTFASLANFRQRRPYGRSLNKLASCRRQALVHDAMINLAKDRSGKTHLLRQDAGNSDIEARERKPGFLTPDGGMDNR